MSIFKDCDIRGVYGEDITEREAGAIGTAVAELLQGRSIVVSGDFRTHTPSLKKAFTEALLAGGAEVWDIGQASTPQLYFSKRYLHTYASAQITASHNPPKYNGLKLMFGDLPIRPEDIEQIGERTEQIIIYNGQSGEKLQNTDKKDCDINKKLHRTDTAEAYENMLLARLSPAAGKLHIVIDAGNGAMSEMAPRVAQKAGIQVTPLFCEYDGTFPNRDPNPAVLSHITALCDKVKEVNADLGIAFDGDGDRAIFVDSDGIPLIAEEAMVIFTDALANPGDSIVYDLKCSSILKQAILRRGAEPVMERSGHAFIRRNFMQRNSVFAGEVSGHYFFRELEGDDGLYAMMVLLDIMGKTGKSLRELLKNVQYTAITPDIRIRAGQEEIEEVMQRMKKWTGEPDVHPVYIDGIRLEFPDDSWLLLRRSITEPAFTVRLEAPDEEKLQTLRKEAEKRLKIQLV